MSTSEVAEGYPSLQINPAEVHMSYQDAAAIAVLAEHRQFWSEAAMLWGLASDAATHPENQHWATARAAYCFRQTCIADKSLLKRANKPVVGRVFCGFQSDIPSERNTLGGKSPRAVQCNGL